MNEQALISSEDLQQMEDEYFAAIAVFVGDHTIERIHATAVEILLKAARMNLSGCVEVRDALRSFFAREAEWQLSKFDASGAAMALDKELLAIKARQTATAPPATAQAEVAARERDFKRANPAYRGVEMDAVVELLLPGERIAAICDDHVETDKPRKIDRFGLRELRPANTETAKAIANWNKNFPTKDEIDAGVRATQAAIERGDDY